MWKPPAPAGMPSPPGPSVRPSAWSRKPSCTASMHARSGSSSRTSRPESTSTALPFPRRGGVQPFEERHALPEDVMVVGRGGQQRADGHVDAAGLFVRVLAVAQVGLVHHL